VNTLSHSRVLSPSRVGLILSAALAALSCFTGDVGDPLRLPATSTESREASALPASKGPSRGISSGSKVLKESGLSSRTTRGAGGSVW
jgi:hypothetical protein